jgi:hypothetical protein
MKKILNEGLDYMDLENQVNNKVSIDEYAAKTGSDDETITLAFTVKGQLASEDLTDWFERGYDFVIDASPSDGEISVGKYLVFVEMNRRSKAPTRIIEMLEDLETLTGIKLKDWIVEVDGEEYDADEEVLKQVMTLSPHEYRLENEKDEEGLNEMRQLSGMETNNKFNEQDEAIKHFKSLAGL